MPRKAKKDTVTVPRVVVEKREETFIVPRVVVEKEKATFVPKVVVETQRFVYKAEEALVGQIVGQPEQASCPEHRNLRVC